MPPTVGVGTDEFTRLALPPSPRLTSPNLSVPRSNVSVMLDAPAPLGPPETPPEREGGLGTFLPELDHVTAGLAPGELWVVTGHPGSGKSILATQFALHWLFQHDVPVTIHSLRDPLFAVWTRLVAHTARVALSPATATGRPRRRGR